MKDSLGYFTIKNPSSELFLIAHASDKIIVEGRYIATFNHFFSITCICLPCCCFYQQIQMRSKLNVQVMKPEEKSK